MKESRMWRRTALGTGVREESLRLKHLVGNRVAGQPSVYRPRGGPAKKGWDRLRWSIAIRSNQQINETFDLNVCERQAIGGSFTPAASDADAVSALIGGSLVLPPHPEWKLPGRIDWLADPFGEDNWKFQLHTLRWIDPLRRVALQDTALSREASEQWLAITGSWIDSCMFANHSVAWKDMAVGVRTIALVLGFPLVPDDRRSKYVACIRMHAAHLENSRNHARGNHLLHQLQGLYVAARFLRSASMETSALDGLNTLFHESYDQEGINAEGALGYHDMNYQWWRVLELRVLAENGMVPDLHHRLELARAALVHGVRPDGVLETIGDTGVNKVPTEDGFEATEFMRSRGSRGVAPGATSVCFPAGYIFGRSGWGSETRDFGRETFYSLRFGADKPMHGHRDSTSFTVFARGVPWVVDPGMYGYGTTAMRRYMCSRAAHNVVIDNARPNYPNQAPELLSWHSDEESDIAIMMSGPSPRFRTRRLFAYHRIGDFFVVCDELAHPRPSEVSQIRQLWHLSASAQVTMSNAAVKLTHAGETAHVVWEDGIDHQVISGQEGPLQGWVTSEYGKSVPAPVISSNFTDGPTPRSCAVLTFGGEIPSVSVIQLDLSLLVVVTLDSTEYTVELPRLATG